jgi:hypothetical protein
MNQDSQNGMAGNSYNCGLIALDNLNVPTDDLKASPKYGMHLSDLLTRIHEHRTVRRIHPTPTTMRQFLLAFPEGEFFIHCSNHFCVVRDREVLNCKKNKRIRAAFQIEPKLEPKHA